MRDLSRLIAFVGLASLVIAPLPVAAEEPPVDTDTDEPPVDTDSEEPPLDTDTDEPPLDTDTDEPPLDTDTDEPPAPELDSDTNVEVEDGYNPLRDSPEARVARRWLGAGIAATASGALLVGGAIALGLTDPCDPAVGNNCFADARNRAAITMGVPGGVMLLGGVAMTIVGALQKRRMARELTGGLSASRDHIGVVFVGRF